MSLVTKIKSVRWLWSMMLGWPPLRNRLARYKRKMYYKRAASWSAVIAPPKVSPVSVCFIGNRSQPFGSWSIRGEQMASTRSNWKATLDPTPADLDEFEIYCFVKHPIQTLIDQLRNNGKVVIYDIVDSWKQPEEGLIYSSLDQAREYFGPKWKSLGVDHFIFPNRQMQLDLGDLVEHGDVIYHHYWPNRGINTPRKNARVVAYEGTVSVIREWLPIMRRVCGDLGLKFALNPINWSKVDIVADVRGGEHDTFLANSYKSNVKLANCYGSGIPVVAGDKQVSFHETDNGDVRFFQTESELKQRLSDLLDYETRVAIHERFLQARSRFSISSIADEFEQFFLGSLVEEKSDSMKSAPG